ncbi:MAG TPA: heme-binding protein [Candidatus Xenobia bacterium]
MLISRDRIKLTLEGARVMMAAAVRKATDIGIDMAIAIVDEGGTLIALERMDGAKITGVEVAIGKAFTAACTRLPTERYADIAKAGGPAFGINAAHPGRFMIVGGGLPIQVEGQTIGGIGASSGAWEQDRDVGQAGIDALLLALKG